MEALLEPLIAGLVYPVPSSRPQQGEKVVIRAVGILNDSPIFILAAPGVRHCLLYVPPNKPPSAGPYDPVRCRFRNQAAKFPVRTLAMVRE